MNKKTIVLFISIVAVLFASSCKPKQFSVNVINLNKIQGLKGYSNVYALPKTAIRVKLTVERENYVKGPYYQYAQAYLGLSDFIQEDKQSWRIASVGFETYPIADTNNFYLIETVFPEKLLQFSISKEGFLESVNEKMLTSNQLNYQNNKFDNQVSNQFENIELHDNVDITFDDVPVPKEILAKRAASEQASALANKILVLRDDRAAILVGDGYTQALPVGETMQTMINEIDKIQESYMSMFKGKIVKETFTYAFDFVPEEPRKRTQAILFRFSEQNGVVDNSEISGMPVIIEIESFENLKQLEQLKKRQFYLNNVASKKEIDKGLYYRIPEMGIARLIKNDRVLFEEKVQIAQFGSIQNLPVKYLDGKYTIQFYPDFGSIKNIFLNETESFKVKK